MHLELEKTHSDGETFHISDILAAQQSLGKNWQILLPK